ncbi:MAG: hypothetical protein JO076_04080 [Verrucomicrobia bacterium]|nr:hypothetical protein [Verrucomicrobiota bacterium]
MALPLAVELFSTGALWKSNEQLHDETDRLEDANAQNEKYVSELKIAAPKISGIFTRLNDSVVRVKSIEGKLPIPGQKPAIQEQPKTVRAWQDYGFSVIPQGTANRESSVCFQIVSDQMEFHRVIPALAEQENSNALLFIDKLTLIRPAKITAFALTPVALKTRFTVRLLTSSK